MRQILRDMSNDELHTKYKQLIRSIDLLEFETRIVATSKSPNDKKTHLPICHDNYTNISLELDSILANMAKQKKSFTTQINELRNNFRNSIHLKYDYILNTNDNFIAQSFKDECADRIYSIDAFSAIHGFVDKVMSMLCDSCSYESIDKLLTQCKTLSKDEILDEVAGKPISSLGYYSLSDVTSLYSAYEELLLSSNCSTMVSIPSNIRKHTAGMIKHKQQLDSTMSSDIASGKSVDTTSYQGLLDTAVYSQKVYDLITGTVELMDRMYHTVFHLVDTASRCKIANPTMDITTDMGGPLIPLIIEEKSVAYEGFVGKIIDRFKVYATDTKNVIDSESNIDKHLSFINKHISDEELNKFKKLRKWSLPKFDDVQSAYKLMKSKLNLVLATADKYNRATKPEDIWKYPISKGFGIPEILLLDETLRKVGVNYSVFYYNKYTGEWDKPKSLSTFTDIMTYDSYKVGNYIQDNKFPTYNMYLRGWVENYRPTRINSTAVGFTDRNTLNKLQEFNSNTMKDMEELSSNFPDNNLNLSGVKDPKTRESTVVNYWRSYIWESYAYGYISAYMFCAYYPYIVISTIKKYA